MAVNFYQNISEVQKIEFIKLLIDPIDITEQTPFLAEWFPNLFADALVPINPIRWLAYTTGSAMASDMPEFGDKIQTPFTNFLVTKEYLETSKSDIQWRDRFWKMVEDTTTINILSEIGGDFAAFGGGAMLNKIADRYVEKMVKTIFTLRKSEKLNLRIYQEFPRQHQI
jgi:hypothetical protein